MLGWIKLLTFIVRGQNPIQISIIAKGGDEKVEPGEIRIRGICSGKKGGAPNKLPWENLVLRGEIKYKSTKRINFFKKFACGI